MSAHAANLLEIAFEITQGTATAIITVQDYSSSISTDQVRLALAALEICGVKASSDERFTEIQINVIPFERRFA